MWRRASEHDIIWKQKLLRILPLYQSSRDFLWKHQLSQLSVPKCNSSSSTLSYTVFNNCRWLLYFPDNINYISLVREFTILDKFIYNESGTTIITCQMTYRDSNPFILKYTEDESFQQLNVGNIIILDKWSSTMCDVKGTWSLLSDRLGLYFDNMFLMACIFCSFVFPSQYEMVEFMQSFADLLYGQFTRTIFMNSVNTNKLWSQW
jgi:hypothetical protein